jgi:short-subunit dehydrogenase
MNIFLTGGTSGVGLALTTLLNNHNVIAPSRQELDLSNIDAVSSYVMPHCDMLINCAGTDVGGKVDFVQHQPELVLEIMTVNLLAPVLLSQKALANPLCKIVNITSTNNNRYWPNNLAYSLSKNSLEDFGNMLRLDYPAVRYLEFRLGLTKTKFNVNRYREHPERYNDVYTNPHLTTDQVAEKLVHVMFDDAVKFIEVAP